MSDKKKGKVFLVGAGPGDPALLTLKGKACLSKADVIVYDYLANRVFLEYAKSEAALIYVGKKAGCHTMSQAEINTLIIDHARKGKHVVRLKGGDPFIFGRGGEEAQELNRAGIPFEIIPGVTSAVSVPAYAGIPLTHRDYTSTVAFITGHEDPKKNKTDIHWDKLAKGIGTLVFLMGVGNIEGISRHLIANGRHPETPVAVIQQGTVPEQMTVVGDLETIAERVQSHHIKPPAVIVVGDVVRLRERLNWFETKPLFGRRIMITRAREQASEFRRSLEQLGAHCIEFPTIKIIPPQSWEKLDAAIQSIGQYQWVLFTSPNGVRYFLERLKFNNKDIRDLKGIKIGAIGPKTAAFWHQVGINPDLMPDEYRAEAVVAQFEQFNLNGKKILLPRAAEAREILPEKLKEMGADVDVIPTYRTIMPDHDIGDVEEMLKSGSISMITFTSSSTVKNFVGMFDKKSGPLTQWIGDITVACIGPITAETAEKYGFKVAVQPDEYTIESLRKHIVRFYSHR